MSYNQSKLDDLKKSERGQVMSQTQETRVDHICRTNHVNIHSNSSLLVLLDFNKASIFSFS